MSRTNRRAIESENAELRAENAELRDCVATLEEQNLVLESLAGDAEKHLAQCQRNCENLSHQNRELRKETEQLESLLSAHRFDPEDV